VWHKTLFQGRGFDTAGITVDDGANVPSVVVPDHLMPQFPDVHHHDP
jgi:hypothetical protein